MSKVFHKIWNSLIAKNIWPFNVWSVPSFDISLKGLYTQFCWSDCTRNLFVFILWLCLQFVFFVLLWTKIARVAIRQLLFIETCSLPRLFDENCGSQNLQLEIAWYQLQLNAWDPFVTVVVAIEIMNIISIVPDKCEICHLKKLP